MIILIWRILDALLIVADWVQKLLDIFISKSMHNLALIDLHKE